MFSEVDIVTGGGPDSVAVRINEAIQKGYQLIGTIQGFSEPDGRAYFWATMGKPAKVETVEALLQSVAEE